MGVENSASGVLFVGAKGCSKMNTRSVPMLACVGSFSRLTVTMGASSAMCLL